MLWYNLFNIFFVGGHLGYVKVFGFVFFLPLQTRLVVDCQNDTYSSCFSVSTPFAINFVASYHFDCGLDYMTCFGSMECW